MSFQLRNSAYRHVSFLFQKDYSGAYKTFALPILLIGSFMLISNLYLPEELKIGEPQATPMDVSYSAMDVSSYEQDEAALLNSDTICRYCGARAHFTRIKNIFGGANSFPLVTGIPCPTLGLSDYPLPSQPFSIWC